MGETSGSAIRALSLGKPLVVSDVGWFTELPDEVALKVAPGGEDEVVALAAALGRLAEPGVAERMGAMARAYVEAEHDLGRVAERYAAALEQAAGDALVRERVLREVAQAAAEVGIEPEPLAPALAEAAIVSPDGRVSSGHVPRPGRGTWPLGRWPVWAWLGGLYAVAVAVLLALGLRVSAPWIMVDELVYSDMARSFAATGHFLIRGAHAGYGPLYPLLLSPVYAAIGPVVDVYGWLRVVNALLAASAVFPAYLLARRVVKQPAALGAAVLTVAVPSLAYVGTVMTENLFYPLFLWLALALVLALERPTVARQLAVLALCAAAFETRAQTVALVVAVASAPLLLAWIERGRPRRLSVWAPLYGVLAAAVVLVVLVEVARGRSPAAVLGNYSVTSGGGYRPWPALRWLVLHVAELDLYLWVLPFAALIVLVANARHLDARLRAFAAATAALSVWLSLEVAVFASRYSLRIEERNLFYLVPLCLIALLAWIERGQPRPPRAAVAAAGLAAALPGAIPFLGLLNITAQSDTLGLQPWWYLGEELAGRGSVGVAAVLVSSALAAAFLWLPRRYAPVLPLLVALGFLATWLPLELWTHSFPRLGSSAVAQGIGNSDRSWIDRAVGPDARVAVLWTGGNDLAVWENEFWNRSVSRVYDLTTPLGGDMPSTHVSVERSTGILRTPAGGTIPERYVLTRVGDELRGTPVARDKAKGLVLYRVLPPARTTTTVTGLYDDPVNPWSNAHPVWTRYQCRGGTLTVVVSSDRNLFQGKAQTVRVTGTTPARTFRISSATSGTRLTFPLEPERGICRVAFDIAPARRPADYPRLHRDDPRLLGLHFESPPFRYSPPK
ncbi:MAG: glycosyltransferase family 39 protein [Thermoleophilia bacterium]|nr:glycosyltransferase family 39 protein [Thermoleophilia bacterium]